MPPAVLGNISRLRSAKVAKTIPIVQDGVVIADQTDGSLIRLDTPAWFTWLEAATTTRFSYALHNHSRGYIDGFMTVRKERRQRGTTYWTVYRRQGRRLRKVYVGPSTALTAARLEQIAAQLRPRDGPRQTHTSLSEAPWARRSCRQSFVEVVAQNIGSTIIREATRANLVVVHAVSN